MGNFIILINIVKKKITYHIIVFIYIEKWWVFRRYIQLW